MQSCGSGGKKVIVGVQRHDITYWNGGKNGGNNAGMADHFVSIDKPVSDGYHFNDPGTLYPYKGTSPSNVFRLGNNGLYTGSSFGKPMTISWIGLNR